MTRRPRAFAMCARSTSLSATPWEMAAVALTTVLNSLSVVVVGGGEGEGGGMCKDGRLLVKGLCCRALSNQHASFSQPPHQPWFINIKKHP